MAELQIKAELASEPLSMPDPPDHIQLVAPKTESVSPSPPSMEFYWKCCEEEVLTKRVNIKESAVDAALSKLRQILPVLNVNVEGLPSCQYKIDALEDIISRKRNVTILVCFLGVTGAGKTTLLNALIGYHNLLPTSNWRAGTAVAVEVSFNPESGFRAEILYIAAEDWRQELEAIFEDIRAKARSLRNPDDDDADSLRDGRIKDAHDKLVFVYPHLDTIEKLEASSVDELLEHPNVQDVLGNTKTLKTKTKVEFARQIRKFIDSGDGRSKTVSAVWPLVKVVKIYCKADILEHGITLVDLPGCQDSNASRSRVAESYQQALSLSCVVGDVNRGIGDSTVQELLDKHTKRTLQLDGNFSSDSLAFVLTKCDINIEPANYIRDCPELRDVKGHFDTACTNLKNTLATQDQEKKRLKKSIAQTKKDLTEVKKLSRAVKASMKALAPTPQRDRKKKRPVDDTEIASEPQVVSPEQLAVREELEELDEELDGHQDRIEELESLQDAEVRLLAKVEKRIERFHIYDEIQKSSLMSACREHRSKMSSDAVRREFDRTMQEMDCKAGKPLQVFAAAATVHLEHLHTSRRHPGFPNSQDTGVSALQDWIMGTTLNDREACAQNFLVEVESEITRLQAWIQEKFKDAKMPANTREHWEGVMANSLDQMTEGFEQLKINNQERLRTAVEAELYSSFPKAIKLAVKKAPHTAENWVGKTYWSTHRCCNRGHGTWTTSSGASHRWNEDLMHDISDHFIKNWERILGRILPAQKTLFIKDAEELIDAFAEKAANQGVCPEGVEEAMRSLVNHIKGSRHVLRPLADDFFTEISSCIKGSHRASVVAIKDFNVSMYQECANNSGRGVYAKNQAIHQRHMKKKAVTMYTAATDAIRKVQNDKFENVPKSLKKVFDPIIKRINDETKRFFEDNTAAGVRTTSRKVADPKKTKMSPELQKLIDDLSNEWVSESLAPKAVWEDDEVLEIDTNTYIDLNADEDDGSDYGDNALFSSLQKPDQPHAARR